MHLPLLREMVLGSAWSLYGQIFEYGIRFKFSRTNNVSEYEAFLAGLGLVKSLKAFPLYVHSDSQLIVG
jgi:ribonuclease HI